MRDIAKLKRDLPSSTEAVQWGKDSVMPQGKWEFDEEVAGCFNDMLQRSIPQYDVMRKTVAELASKFMKPKSQVLDMGCSNGEVIESLLKYEEADIDFVGLEISEPMIKQAKQRFRGLDNVKIEKCDLRSQFPGVRASVILSVLTLQFTPIEYRMEILWNVHRSLLINGAFILVEKVLGASSDIDTVMRDGYYTLKAENGYSQEQIYRKKLALEGVLVPVTSSMNIEFLKSAGFTKIDCFWRWMNFAAWIAIKG